MHARSLKKSRRILIVEDDEAIMEALKELLEGAQYQVDCAYNGKEAIGWLHSHPLPSLILLDLMMPVMDGFQFREEQLKMEKIKNIPVVVMSADGQVEKKLRQISAQDYLKKPVKIETVLNTIGRYFTDY